QIVDDLSERLCVALDSAERPAGSLVVELAGPHQLSPSENRVQRCTQLMGDGREELIFEPVCRLGISSRLFLASQQLLAQSLRLFSFKPGSFLADQQPLFFFLSLLSLSHL